MSHSALPKTFLAAAFGFGWLFCAILCPVPVSADPFELEPITITAPVPEFSPAPVASRTLFTGETLLALGAENLAKALEFIPGLSISAVGSKGAQSTISLRGSSSGQVVILLDGVRTSDPATGLSDLSRLDIDMRDIDTLEVIRGGVSAQYGADAIGGVIAITTKKGSKTPGFYAGFRSTGYLPASYVSGSGANAVSVPASIASLSDGQSLSFRVGLPGDLALSATVGRHQNAFLYRDLNQEKRRRTNADLLEGKARISWQGFIGGGTLSTAAQFQARDLGVPGSIDSPLPEARQQDMDAQASVDYSTDYFLSEAVSLAGVVYAKIASLEYREKNAAPKDNHDSLRTGGEARWSILLDNDATLNTGLSVRYEKLSSSVVLTTANEAPERLSLGIFAEPSIVLGSWSIAPALRWDWTNDFPSGLSCGIGIIKDIAERKTLSVSFSNAYRSPSFDDLYWPASGGAAGNPNLLPESSVGGELRFGWEGEKDVLHASAYARYVQDVILWQAGGDGIWRPSNFGNALYPGFELEYRKALGPWTVLGTYTFLYSYVLSGNLSLKDDRRVPYLPIHRWNGGASYRKGRFALSLDLDYQGLRYRTTDNRAYLPPLLLANASLRLDTSPSTTFYLEGNNLLGEQYESTPGYPMPGFSLTVGFSFSSNMNRSIESKQSD